MSIIVRDYKTCSHTSRVTIEFTAQVLDLRLNGTFFFICPSILFDFFPKPVKFIILICKAYFEGWNNTEDISNTLSERKIWRSFFHKSQTVNILFSASKINIERFGKRKYISKFKKKMSIDLTNRDPNNINSHVQVSICNYCYMFYFLLNSLLKKIRSLNFKFYLYEKIYFCSKTLI